VAELSSAGVALSGANGYTGGGLNQPQETAIDSSGNAWVTNYGDNAVTELSSAGAILSGTNGYTGGGLSFPLGIAIDGAGNAWMANQLGVAGQLGTVTELSSAGAALSGSNGYTGGGLNAPYGIAIDGSGNAWVSNLTNSVTELIGIGIPVMTPIAAGLPVTPTKDGSSKLGTRP
jgi:hypothetical protein